MNRQQRRKHKNIILNPEKEVDHSDAQWCWRHPQIDPDNKKATESVRLVPFKVTNKDGTVSLGRSCKRCGNAIMVKSPLIEANKTSILELPGENDPVL